MKFLALTENGNGQQCELGLMKCSWVLAGLFSICCAFRVIGQAIVTNEVGTPVTAVGTVTGMHQLAAILLSGCEFVHDGALVSVLCFVVIFGERALSSFAGLCVDILEFCGAQTSNVVSLPRPCKVETVISGNVHAQQLAEKFTRVKVGFGIYS